jgi:hypothetical protein
VGHPSIYEDAYLQEINASFTGSVSKELTWTGFRRLWTLYYPKACKVPFSKGGFRGIFNELAQNPP